MHVVEFVGIIVLECPNCKRQFVVNSENVKQGFQIHCQCGRYGYSNLNSKLAVSITPGTPYEYMDNDSQKRFDRSLTQSNAMPIEQYKSMLVEAMLGKKPKVPASSKNVISFEGSGIDIVSMIKGLQTLGYTEKEAKEKINVAVKDGFKYEDEILRYILSLGSSGKSNVPSEVKREPATILREERKPSKWEIEWERKREKKEREKEEKKVQQMEKDKEERQRFEKIKHMDEQKLLELLGLTVNPQEKASILDKIDLIRKYKNEDQRKENAVQEYLKYLATKKDDKR